MEYQKVKGGYFFSLCLCRFLPHTAALDAHVIYLRYKYLSL